MISPQYSDYQTVADRLDTFGNWPQEHAVKSKALAEAGFFFTGIEDKVACFSCGCTINNWQPDDVPLEEHAKKQPICDFLRNKFEPHHRQKLEELKRKSANRKLRRRFELYKDVKNREVSFDTWPHDSVQPEALAEAGFFYISEANEIRCFHCDTFQYGWEPGDEPLELHVAANFDCGYLREKFGTEYQKKVTQLLAQRERRLQQLMVYPKYDEIEERLHTFDSWPLVQVDPQSLAEAGFFYTRIADRVCCHYCGIGLNEWEAEDDPLEEHVEVNSDCGFLRHKFGENYEKKVEELRTKRQRRLDDKANKAKIEIIEKKEDEDEEMGEVAFNQLCKLCGKTPYNMAILPCGDVFGCETCVQELESCLQCGNRIECAKRLLFCKKENE